MPNEEEIECEVENRNGGESAGLDGKRLEKRFARNLLPTTAGHTTVIIDQDDSM